VVAYFFGPPCIYKHRAKHLILFYTIAYIKPVNVGTIPLDASNFAREFLD